MVGTSRGGETGFFSLSLFPSSPPPLPPGASFCLKTVSCTLRKYVLGSEKSGSWSMCLIFHLIVSIFVQEECVFVACALRVHV